MLALMLVLPIILLLVVALWMVDSVRLLLARRRYLAAVIEPALESELGDQFQEYFKVLTRQRELPYIEVAVGVRGVRVPDSAIVGPTITFNISFEAVDDLRWEAGNLMFRAMFAGNSESVSLPLSSLVSLYSGKTGQGLLFDRAGQAH